MQCRKRRQFHRKSTLARRNPACARMLRRAAIPLTLHCRQKVLESIRGNSPLSVLIMFSYRFASVPRVAFISTVLVFCFAYEAGAQVPDVPGWQLFFHDEFDGNSLNTTNWTALDRQD